MTDSPAEAAAPGAAGALDIASARGQVEGLRWLFLDLNSYFASVEQNERPELRGKPVAVVAVMTDSTCAIAASYEAKAFGIRTGTPIWEARRRCPDLQLIQARHDLYVDYHHRIVEEVDRHLPVDTIASIDEMAGPLAPADRDPARARELAARIKLALLQRIGPSIRCSIGLASNRYLGKVASDLEKPDGLVVLTAAEWLRRLPQLQLRDLPGIGANLEQRLRERGYRSVADLYRAEPKRLRQAWGSVGGERMWLRLHGVEIPDEITRTRTIGHSHVLAPEFRHPHAAGIVARRLLLKTASRLRRARLRARAMELSIRLQDGERTRHEAHRRFAPATDSHSLMHHLLGLWHEVLETAGVDADQRAPDAPGPAGDGGGRAGEDGVLVRKIAVTLSGLESLDQPEQLELGFERPAGEIDSWNDPRRRRQREQLSRVMDEINQQFGRDAVALGFSPDQVKTFSGTKIAFSRIPDREEFKE